MLSIANLFFGTPPLGKYGLAAALLIALVISWQIDRAWVRSHAKDQGRTEERDKVKAANRKAASVADRVRAKSKSRGVRGPIDPYVVD
ncbi:MAG: hypothetical protein K0U61_02545 [Alphaproteobacteria bacterium]|nr:hypothetical protein [Alphaproteobacteria bacterium]